MMMLVLVLLLLVLLLTLLNVVLHGLLLLHLLPRQLLYRPHWLWPGTRPCMAAREGTARAAWPGTLACCCCCLLARADAWPEEVGHCCPLLLRIVHLQCSAVQHERLGCCHVAGMWVRRGVLPAGRAAECTGAACQLDGET